MSIRTQRGSKRIAAAVATAAVAASALAFSAPASAVTPTTAGNRIEGTNRYGTAAALATKYVTHVGAGWSGNLVVASGDNFPDALAAASIAKVKDAPILLVPSDGSMPSAIRDWLLVNRSTIQGKTAPSITVIGGESAVPTATVTTMLATINEGDTTPATSTRLSGADRYATAAAVAAASGVISAGDNVLLVSGENFADAVSVAPLANANGWPIVLTNSTSLNASAAAAIAAVKAVNAGAKVIIVGGPAAVSYGVEEQLVLAGIKYENIVRIAGADRYQTSLLVNVAMTGIGGGLAAPQFDGTNVALATGENFADAVAAAPFLAANNAASAGIHLQLTKSNELSLSASGLVAAIAASGRPSTLYAIGGTSAISANTLAAAVAAAQSPNMVGTLTCLEGSDTVLLTLPSAVGTFLELQNLSSADLAINGASSGSTASAGVFDDAGKVLAFSIAPATLAAGSVVTFGGNTEAQSEIKRTITAPACTVADDATAPTLTITAASNSAGVFYVTPSEPISGFDGTDVTTSAAGVTSVTVSAAGTAYKVTLLAGSSPAPLATGNTITIAAAGVTDLAGNPNAAATATAVADATAPTFTVLTTSLAITTASASAGGLTLAAVTGGAADGKAGNGWKLSVVNRRGLVLPTVVADATAKTVVVTADTMYTDAADVARFVTNRGLLAGWTLTASGTLAATTTAGTTTGGTDLVTIYVAASEFLSDTRISAVAATLNGAPINIASLEGAPVANELFSLDGKTFAATYVTAVPGALALTWSSALDVAGNNGYGTFTGTIS